MKVTYDKTLNAYKIIYKDALAELQGKRPYVRIQRSAGKTRPKAEDRKAGIRKWEAWALEQEKMLKEEAENTPSPTVTEEASVDVPILASEFLKSVKGQILTNSSVTHVINRARRIVDTFVKFLEEIHPGIYLHQINKQVAANFVEWLTKRRASYSYKTSHWQRLSYIFNMLSIKFEDSKYNYRNPFRYVKLKNLAEEEPTVHRKTFSPEVIRLLLHEARTWGDNSKYKCPEYIKIQRWAILSLLAMTGIRPKDAFIMKWEQINLERRTLTITHTKTRRKGINSVIWLTPHLMDLFSIMKELHEKHKAINKDYIFSLYNHVNSEKEIEEYLSLYSGLHMKKFFIAFRKKYGLTEFVPFNNQKHYVYSLYSLRGTVGTLLTWAQFNANSIDYLQGHKPKNTTSKFYINQEANPRAATEEMVDYLAYTVIRQPLGEVGAYYAAIDHGIDKAKVQEKKSIEHIKELAKSGLLHGTNVVLKKVIDEAKKLDEEKSEMIKKYGMDLLDALYHDDSPQ